MSNKFLGSGNSVVGISDGSTNLYGASLGAVNLDPSQPLKTNATRNLVSSKLDIADVNSLQSALDGKLANPLDADFNFNNNNVLNANTI